MYPILISILVFSCVVCVRPYTIDNNGGTSPLNTSDGGDYQSVYDDGVDGPRFGHGRYRRYARTSHVKLSSRKYYELPVPVLTRADRHCKTRMDYIDPDGSAADRAEYHVISNELAKTIIHDMADCDTRGGCVTRFKIFEIKRIINKCLWEGYKDRRKDVEDDGGSDEEWLMFFGTDNPWQYAEHGFDERQAYAGRPFGAGIYFTSHSTAANEFAYGDSGTGCPRHGNPACTKCKRRMILARVTLGKWFKMKDGETRPKTAHAPVGFHCVVGKQTKNPYSEYAIFRGEQAYPAYVVSYVIR